MVLTDRADTEAVQIGGFGGRQVEGKEAQNLTGFALRDLRPFVVAVFPIHIRSLAVH